MRPSQEAKLRKDIITLFKANDELDVNQSLQIGKLKKDVDRLSRRIGKMDKDIEILKFKKG